MFFFFHLVPFDRDRLSSLVAYENVFGRHALCWDELTECGLSLNREEAMRYVKEQGERLPPEREALYELLFDRHPELKLSLFYPEELLERFEGERRENSNSTAKSNYAEREPAPTEGTGELDVEVEEIAVTEAQEFSQAAAVIPPGGEAKRSDPSRERAALTYEAVIAFLDENPGEHTYGDVAEGLGLPRGVGGRAVGAMMRAIHNRGLHEYCVRVVNAKTGKHGCDKAGD